MVAIFLIATALFFLGLDYLIQRARKRKGVEQPAAVLPVSPERFLVPRGYFFNPGHTWAELLPSGAVRVGIDDFLQKIVGKIDSVHVLKQQSSVERGEPVLVLKQKDRLLSVRAPMAGNVVAVNEEAVNHPELLAEDPYDAGWILMMEPSRLEDDLRTLVVGSSTAKWLKREVARFRDFIRAGAVQPQYAHAGITMADGGVPLTGALAHTDAEGWKDFESQFLAVPAENSPQFNQL